MSQTELHVQASKRAQKCQLWQGRLHHVAMRVGHYKDAESR